MIKPRIFSRLLIVFIAALHGLGSATPLGTSPQGLWTGTLGNNEIVACFDRRGENERPHGSYYYARYLRPISLTPQAGKGEWTEGPDASWILTSIDDTQLNGVWRRSDGHGDLPVHLSRLSGTSARHGCGSDLYNLPLEREALRVAIGPIKYFGQKRYRPISIAGVQLIELVDKGLGIAAINRQLRAELPGGDGDVRALREQLRELVKTQGRYVFDTVSAEPIEWNDRLVTIQLHRDFAGEGAAGAENGFRTWNVVSGAEIDPWRWLGGASGRSADLSLPVIRRTGVLSAKLKSYLMKVAHVGSECRAVYDESSVAGIHVSEIGVEFLLGNTFHPECMQNVLVSPEAMQPFLNTEGKSGFRWLTKR
ncbi:hypothetical protein [Massilia sp. Root335]|uniref:hypothetical protein n=1 Tax=Massilia sp. Root335 TaxID=1736517 RepID=UPI000A84A36E|nr:hypothetical protein [Massilia sp. Root335]